MSEQTHTEDDVIHGMAVHLVMLIHLSMNWDIWGSKRLKYWEILQDNIATAAYTDKLSRWLSNICNRMQIPKAGRNDQERQMIFDIISSGKDKGILRHLREETHYVIVEVQVNRQEVKEARETEQPQDSNQEMLQLDETK